jgi:hypothetical protein
MIIGLCGQAFSGKDTAALAFQEYEEIDYFTFAKPLKDAVQLLFNMTHEQLYDSILKEELDDRWGKSPRQILQWLGTDILRENIDKNFFTKHMEQRIAKSKADCIVITDVRFENEAKVIKALGGKIVKITRPNVNTTKHNTHITEQGLPDHLIDIEIINNGTVEELHTKMKVFCIPPFLRKRKNYSFWSSWATSAACLAAAICFFLSLQSLHFLGGSNPFD